MFLFCECVINPDLDVETEYIAKKRTNRASKDTFAERRCQFIAYESETFHRRRRNGISHCENGEQKPPKRLLPVVLR